MRLDAYLKEVGESPCAWARKHGFPLPVITRFLKGQRGVSLKTALKISSATGGRVQPQDLQVAMPITPAEATYSAPGQETSP